MKIPLKKCPSCKTKNYVQSVFGSVCRECLYSPQEPSQFENMKIKNRKKLLFKKGINTIRIPIMYTDSVSPMQEMTKFCTKYTFTKKATLSYSYEGGSFAELILKK